MKVIVNGALGHMGAEVMRLVSIGYKDSALAAAVDFKGGRDGVYRSLFEYTGQADVIVDFSNHKAGPELMDYAVKRSIPVVAATTGYTEEETAIIEKAAQKVAIFKSGNMSVGIALLRQLVKKTAQVLGDADVEIIETHHNRKLDAPSGTALMLADSVREARPDSVFVCGRSGQGKREANDIGIHAVRMGNVVGVHEVIFGTGSQTVSLKHEVHDRALLAEGAMAAAAFLIGKQPGLYDMDDMLKF